MQVCAAITVRLPFTSTFSNSRVTLRAQQSWCWAQGLWLMAAWAPAPASCCAGSEPLGLAAGLASAGSKTTLLLQLRGEKKTNWWCLNFFFLSMNSWGCFSCHLSSGCHALWFPGNAVAKVLGGWCVEDVWVSKGAAYLAAAEAVKMLACKYP